MKMAPMNKTAEKEGNKKEEMVMVEVKNGLSIVMCTTG
jgi:hypothetical protein